MLGDGPAGVLVADFYGTHPYVRAPKQRCWSHVLRDAHELRPAHPPRVRSSFAVTLEL